MQVKMKQDIRHASHGQRATFLTGHVYKAEWATNMPDGGIFILPTKSMHTCEMHIPANEVEDYCEVCK